VDIIHHSHSMIRQNACCNATIALCLIQLNSGYTWNKIILKLFSVLTNSDNLKQATQTVKFAAPCNFPEDERKRVHVGLTIGLEMGRVHSFIEHFRCHVATCPLASVIRLHVDFTGLAKTSHQNNVSDNTCTSAFCSLSTLFIKRYRTFYPLSHAASSAASKINA